MNNKKFTKHYKVAHSNRKKREVTFLEYNENYRQYWRTYPLSNDDFGYYTRYATESDIKNFLRNELYQQVTR